MRHLGSIGGGVATRSILFAIACAACGDGGSSTTNPDAGGTGTTCQATLSGAVTGTFSCLITLSYTAQNDRTSFGFSVPMPAPENMINGVATRPGMPSATETWTQTDATGTGAFFVQSTGIPAQSWIASSGSSVNQGSYSLTFMPGSPTVFSQITTYEPTGSFTVSLPGGPGTGTVGTVMMTATF